MSKCHPCHPPVPTWPPSTHSAGRSPPDPGGRRDPDRLLHRSRQADGGQSAHWQRHHPLRPGHLRPGGRRSRRLLRSSRTDRHRARRAAAALPPAPRCLPNAARRGGGLFAHAEACGFGHRSRHRTPISGSIKVRVLTRARGRCECCGAGCCLANPAPTGPGGGPHRAKEPWRFGRPQQPAGALLPLQCRQARRLFAYARGHHRLPRFQASDALRGTDQKGKVAATSERRISRVSGSMGEGSKPMCR